LVKQVMGTRSKTSHLLHPLS